MKSLIKMSILPLLVCLSLNGKALADLSCNEFDYLNYIQSSAKTQKLIAETGHGCDLTRTYLYGANLTGADLTGADLTGADLSWADLRRADLTGAFLNGADLRRAEITGAKFWWAIYDDDTEFPEGFDPVEFKMKKTLAGDNEDN